MIAYQSKIGISPFGDKLNPLLQTREEHEAAYYGNNEVRHLEVNDEDIPDLDFDNGLASHLFYNSPEGGQFYDPGPGYYIPLWQSAPFLSSVWINLNLNTRYSPSHRKSINKAYDQQQIVMGEFTSAPPGDAYSDTGNYLTNLVATWMSFSVGESVTYNDKGLCANL